MAAQIFISPIIGIDENDIGFWLTAKAEYSHTYQAQYNFSHGLSGDY